MHRLGPYHLLGELGAGGMGVVYRAEHTGSGRVVALKTIRQGDAEILQSIRREVKALARLSHPNIVKILDEGVEKGVPYYAMELVAGTSLRGWRARARGDRRQVLGAQTTQPWWTQALDGALLPAPSATLAARQRAIEPLDPKELEAILTLTNRFCRPLAFLHGEGIVHRDLKPDNVLVRDDGEPVLVDFGLASVARASRESRELLWIDQQVAGTPLYMSPEQIVGEGIDARTDIYALGVILFELLTGEHPFEGPSVRDVLEGHIRAPVPRPSSRRPGIPSSLDRLVMRLLSKHKEQRPGYAEDVANELVALGADAAKDDAPPPRPYLYRPRFSGRAAAIEQLRERVLRGTHGVVLLGGESGAGKTRLVTEVGREAVRAGHAVLVGGCIDERNPAALVALRGPLVAIADQCRGLGAGETERVFAEHGSVLGLYEPAVASLPGLEGHPAPAPLPRELALERLHAALEHVLVAFAPSRRLLIVLDDLQWADPLSLGFLAYVAGRPDRGSSFVIVGAYRSEAIGPGLQDLLGNKEVSNIALGRLSEAAIGDIVDDMLAVVPAPERLKRYVSASAEGNPFFAAEYLRAAVVLDLLYRDSAGVWRLAGRFDGDETLKLPLPDSLRALVQRRLADLPEQARRVLHAAALAGRSVQVGLIEAAARLDDDRTSEALQELIRRQVIEEVAPGEVRFTHDKLREAGIADLEAAPGDRVRLHRAIGEWLEENRGENPSSWASIAEHLAAAVRGGESDPALAERAIAAAERAGRQAAERYAVSEAVSLLGTALDLLRMQPPSRAHLERELALETLLGPLLMNDRGYASDAASRSFSKARELCGKLGVSPALFWAIWGMFGHAQLRGEHRKALLFGNELAELAAQAGERALHAEAHFAVALTSFYLADLDTSIARFEQSIASYGEADGKTGTQHTGQNVQVTALASIALPLWLRGSEREALRRCEQAKRASIAAGHPFSICYAFYFAGWLHLLRRDAAEARRCLARGAEVAASNGFPIWLTMGQIFEGTLLARAGDGATGAARIREGIAAWENTGARLLLPSFMSFLAEALDGAGERDAAMTAIERSIELATRTEERFYLPEQERLRADILERKGRCSLCAYSSWGAAWQASRSRSRWRGVCRPRSRRSSSRTTRTRAALGGAMG